MPILVFLAGLFAGVVINLLADSLPRARRIQVPHCPACGASRPVGAWSGLAALATGQWRCRECDAPHSPRHIVVELVTPLLFLFTWSQTGTTVTTLFRGLYVTALTLITVTDIEHRLILEAVSIPAILIGIAGAYLSPAFDKPARSLLGGAIGFAGALLLFLLGALFAAYLERRHNERLPGPAFGFGDVTLSTFLGLILGAPDIIFALVFGILAGFLGAVGYLLSRRVLGADRAPFSAFLPYGPFLICGAAIMFFWGDAFMNWYTGG
jgi:prepilin signal peptidase PulO-like enzyme (type II secretory pathway)